jgi:FkbM family methyltransferase
VNEADLAALPGPGPMSLTRLRLLKLAAVASHREYWRPFWSSRVLPTAEFEHLPFLPGIRTVLDVGANRGQFALFARRRFPGAAIHMFEPVREAAAVARRVVPGAVMHEVALGASAGEVEFFVHPDSDQSSTLPVEGAAAISVPAARLDALEIDLEGPVLLKMDVQGAELAVMEGAAGILDRVDQVLCEVSVAGYIEGAPSAGDVFAFLTRRGFRPAAKGPLLPYGTDVLFTRSAR